MGKWASNAKKGSANHLGYLSPPVAALWALSTASATSETITKSETTPGLAGGWTQQTILVSAGTIASNTTHTGSPVNVTGLTTSLVYRVYVAWTNAAFLRVSDWTSLGVFTAGS